MNPKAFRLPTHARPSRYAIDLSTHPARPTFSGSVRIELELSEAASELVLHARELTLRDPVLEAQGERHTPTMELDAARETVTFRLARPVAPGAAALRVRFEGRPNPGMHGLYLAQDGEERAICTQCEATDARAIFPCFDEPEFKARLEWTIRTEDDVVALANGPSLTIDAEAKERVWRFAPTEPVSSYLAAVAVGPFEGTEATEVNGIPLRVWSIRGKASQATFAHRFTEKLFPWYEEYFGLNYPYRKYDQVAVPGFDAGAMENAGLVLFRHNLLLMDPRAASWNQEKMIAKVIAHELAHMWFGNLVTMKWWDDLWLNEAFAEWFAHKGVHAAEPSYLVWSDFQADKNRALVDDALPTTHPIYTAVATPAEALEMFDVITYQKGCAVMRMLENYLGEAPFRDGIRSYMKAFAGKNAAGPDLWRHLAEASGEPVDALMKSWVEQPGFPLISVELTQDSGQPTLILAQRRFFSSPAAAAAPNEQLWNVPMVVRFEDSEGVKEHRFIFGTRDRTEPLPAQGAVRWLYANAHEIGFYRVALAGAALETILAQLPRLAPVEQMGLLEDQWALVRNGESNLLRFVPVLEALAQSTDHHVLRSIAERLFVLDELLEDAAAEGPLGKLRARVAALFEPHLEALGWEPRPGEPQNDIQRRAVAIGAVAGLARQAGAIAACDRWAQQERRDPRSVDANLAGVFVSVAAKFGDAEHYGAWVETYQARRAQGAAPQDSLRYLHTLSAFRHEPLVKQTLLHLDDGVVPQEAIGSVLSQLLGGRHGQVQAWSFLRERWGSLRAKVGDMGISRVVESLGRLPARHRPEIVAFFAENPPAGAERALARGLESLDQREELRGRLTPELLKLFA